VSNYDHMNLTWLVRNIRRLAWAAETTPDPEWTKAHIDQMNYCIQLLLVKFNQ